MSEQETPASYVPESTIAIYPALLGLRDAKADTLELAVMLDDRVPHAEDTPHMMMVGFLRRHWSKLCAAAELEHVMATADATVDRIKEAGGLAKAASLL